MARRFRIPFVANLAIVRDDAEMARLNNEPAVVRQVSGEYKVKDEVLHRLHKQVIRALAELDSWSIRHVHREENAAADDLVNAALDA